MGTTTGIEWSESTWNPLVGCTKVSPGCDHCYAETLVNRFAGHNKGFPNTFDIVTLRPNRLNLPLSWQTPRRIFVNSLSDLFHDDVPDDYIAQVFAVMRRAHKHTFQLLTKRHARMRSLLSSDAFADRVTEIARDAVYPFRLNRFWPLPNVHLVVSVEDQHWAGIRIPVLLDTPAAVRGISGEPLLGPVTLRPEWLHSAMCPMRGGGVLCACVEGDARLDWVIVGGESGKDARPMHPQWARDLRDQCNDAGVAYLFKQWGEWLPRGRLDDGPLPVDNDRTLIFNVDGNMRGRAAGSLTNQLSPFSDDSHCEVMERVGKKAAGRELDGRTWDEYPT